MTWFVPFTARGVAETSLQPDVVRVEFSCKIKPVAEEAQETTTPLSTRLMLNTGGAVFVSLPWS